MLFRSDTELASPSRLVAIALFVALVAATLSTVVRERPSGHWERTTRAPGQVEVEPEAPAAMAFARIDAVPWGRIESITSARGEPHPIPQPAETPLMLELPPGRWVVTLSNPSSEAERRCDLELALDQPASCGVEFERLSVDEYFREAGWWR